MRRRFNAVMGALGMALATAAAPASAADFVFNFTGNTPVDGTTTFRDYKSTDGKLSVRASGWSLGGSTLSNAYLGSYAQGLGVTEDVENGNGNTHVIDNQGPLEFVLLQFSDAVLLSSFTTSPWSLNGSTDSDALIGWGSSSAAWNSTLPLDGKSVSTLNAMLSGLKEVDGGSAASTRPVGAGTASNLWLVAASQANTDKMTDGFKLTGVKASTASVPEPGTWMMMILGFGAMGWAMRRRRDAGATTAAAL